MRISTIILFVAMISCRFNNMKALVSKLKFKQGYYSLLSKMVMSSSQSSEFSVASTKESKNENIYDDFSQLINQHRQSNSPKKFVQL